MSFLIFTIFSCLCFIFDFDFMTGCLFSVMLRYIHLHDCIYNPNCMCSRLSRLALDLDFPLSQLCSLLSTHPLLGSLLTPFDPSPWSRTSISSSEAKLLRIPALFSHQQITLLLFFTLLSGNPFDDHICQALTT